MDITLEFKDEIEKIMENFNCSKDFVCHKANFENLCECKDMSIKGLVVCGENPCKDSAVDCKFGFPYGFSYCCGCPLRVFVAEKLRR